MVYTTAAWKCLPVSLMAAAAVSKLRMSLSASKTRKMSMPFSAALYTKRRTMSSP